MKKPLPKPVPFSRRPLVIFFGALAIIAFRFATIPLLYVLWSNLRILIHPSGRSIIRPILILLAYAIVIVLAAILIRRENRRKRLTVSAASSRIKSEHR